MGQLLQGLAYRARAGARSTLTLRAQQGNASSPTSRHRRAGAFLGICRRPGGGSVPPSYPPRVCARGYPSERDRLLQKLRSFPSEFQFPAPDLPQTCSNGVHEAKLGRAREALRARPDDGRRDYALGLFRGGRGRERRLPAGTPPSSCARIGGRREREWPAFRPPGRGMADHSHLAREMRSRNLPPQGIVVVSLIYFWCQTDEKWPLSADDRTRSGTQSGSPGRS